MRTLLTDSDAVYRRNYASRLRAERLAAGLCPECGKRPPKEGRRTCEECLEHNNAYYKSRRAYLADIGWCTTCGRRPSDIGYKQCRACRLRYSDYRLEWNKRHKT